MKNPALFQHNLISRKHVFTRIISSRVIKPMNVAWAYQFRSSHGTSQARQVIKELMA